MEEMEKQNLLLRQYVQALEQQSQSRQKQCNVMRSRIEKLTSEIQSLNEQRNKANLNENYQKFSYQNKNSPGYLSDLQQLLQILEKKQEQLQVLSKQLAEVKKQNLFLKQKQHQNKPRLSDIFTIYENEQTINESSIQAKSDLNNIEQLKVNSEANEHAFYLKQQISKYKQEITIVKSELIDLIQQLSGAKKQNQDLNKKLNLKSQQLDEVNKFLLYFKKQHQNYAKINDQKYQSLFNEQAKVIAQLTAKLQEKNNIAKDSQIKALNQQLQLIKVQKSTIQTEVSELSQHLKHMQEQLLDKNALILKMRKQHLTIYALQQQLKIKEQEIKNNKDQIVKLIEQLNEKNKILEDQNQNLSELEHQIVSLNKEYSDQTHKFKVVIDSKNMEIANLVDSYQAKLSKLTEQLVRTKDQLSQIHTLNSKNLQIRRLKMSINQLESQKQYYRSQYEKMKQAKSSYKKSIGELKKNNENSFYQQKQRFSQLNDLSPVSVKKSNYSTQLIKNNNNSHAQLKFLISDLKQQLQKVKYNKKSVYYSNKQNYMDQNNNVSSNYRIKAPQISQKFHSPQNSYLKKQQRLLKQNYKLNNQRLNRVITTSNSKNYNQQSDIVFKTQQIIPVHFSQAEIKFNGSNRQPLTHRFNQQKNINKFGQSVKQYPYSNKRSPQTSKWTDLQNKINDLKKQNKQLKKVLFN